MGSLVGYLEIAALNLNHCLRGGDLYLLHIFMSVRVFFFMVIFFVSILADILDCTLLDASLSASPGFSYFLLGPQGASTTLIINVGEGSFEVSGFLLLELKERRKIYNHGNWSFSKLSLLFWLQLWLLIITSSLSVSPQLGFCVFFLDLLRAAASLFLRVSDRNRRHLLGLIHLLLPRTKMCNLEISFFVYFTFLEDSISPSDVENLSLSIEQIGRAHV